MNRRVGSVKASRKKSKQGNKKKQASGKSKKSIADSVIESIESKIISNKDLSDKEKASAAYSTVINTLQQFLATTGLQCRILNEARTLEAALKNSNLSTDDFNVTLIAKPKTQKAVELSQEIKNAEPSEKENKAKVKEKQQESKATS